MMYQSCIAQRIEIEIKVFVGHLIDDNQTGLMENEKGNNLLAWFLNKSIAYFHNHTYINLELLYLDLN